MMNRPLLILIPEGRELIDQGLTTKFILWLDNLVQQKLLVPSNGASKAVGALLLADPLIEKIQ